VTGVDLGALLLRVILAVVMFAHGYNHVFNGGKLPGVARWFASLGFRAPSLQAALASFTELAVAPLLVLGLLTPLAAAGVVGTMLVAFVANHRKNGFFIFRPGEGYEYVVTLIVAALAPAERAEGWTGLALTGGLGGGLGVAVLALFWRPQPKADG